MKMEKYRINGWRIRAKISGGGIMASAYPPAHLKNNAYLAAGARKKHLLWRVTARNRKQHVAAAAAAWQHIGETRSGVA